MSDNIRKLLKALPKAGWKIIVDGNEITARELELQSRYGTLRWGFNGSYDQWGFEEPGGGGSVLVPYSLVSGVLHIGCVRQPRPFQSVEPVWNVPRGFLEPGETHFQTAAREGGEELGFGDSERIFALPGQPGNPNSTFFVTLAGGVRYFAVRFSEKELTQVQDGFVFDKGVVKPVSKDAERIMGCEFFPWYQVAQLGDQFSNTAVARLLAWQHHK